MTHGNMTLGKGSGFRGKPSNPRPLDQQIATLTTSPEAEPPPHFFKPDVSSSLGSCCARGEITGEVLKLTATTDTQHDCWVARLATQLPVPHTRIVCLR
eukprot:363292-Chlamydomonas_euryale.AAC.5